MYRDNTPETVGLEFESVIRSRDSVNKLLSSARRNKSISAVTRDASVESTGVQIGDNTTIFLGSSVLRNSLRRRESIVTGYEIVTNPLDIDTMRKVILDMINLQVKMGEIYSARSSIHVHAGFPSGLIFYKSAVALGIKIEPLLYKLAGMGSEFRGVKNNSAYCRALSLPPAVRLADSPSLAVLSPLSAISSPSYESFWGCFGIFSGDTERYNPLRYMGINVFSSILRGTMEYRFFNYCSISRYVESITRLCQFITDLMIRVPLETSKNIHQVSIFDGNSDGNYRDLLSEIVRIGRYYNSEFPIDTYDMENIYEIIDKTPQPIFEDKVVTSHILKARIKLQDAIRFGLQIIDSAEDPGIVDIHNFTKQDRKLIGEACAN